MHKTLGNISEACIQTGISRQTYYNWLKAHPDFAEEIGNIIEESVDFAESRLKQLMREGNPTAIIFYLKTRGKERGYIEYKRVESEAVVHPELPKIDLELVGGDDEPSEDEPPIPNDTPDVQKKLKATYKMSCIQKNLYAGKK